MSYPNQKIITIHQSTQVPFLKIGKEELMQAYSSIKTSTTFALFLYLAGNADGFKLELSRQAVENSIGIKRSSYYRAVKQLTELGYIYEDNCGRLNFATVPKKGLRKCVQDWEGGDAKSEHPMVRNETEESQVWNKSVPKVDTEINNKEDIKSIEKIEKEPKSETIIWIPPSRPYPLSYLKTIISPWGEYISGAKKGQWLEDEVPTLWKYEDVAMRGFQIKEHADFRHEEAMAISSEILDYEERKKHLRLEDNANNEDA